MPNAAAVELVKKIQRSAFAQLGLPIPEGEPDPHDEQFVANYLKGNPDNQITKSKKQATEIYHWGRPRHRLVAGISDAILNQRVGVLEEICARSHISASVRKSLENVAFGILPGGGLDAFTMLTQNSKQFAILIPEGLFYLTNLVCKLIILQQPISLVNGEAVFLPSASFAQFSLASHPYVRFRFRDMARAFFFDGDPRMALPFLTALPFQDRFAYLLAGTELFVLAHELAHAHLPHLTRGTGAASTEDELEADAFAVSLLTEYFTLINIDIPHIRAATCGFLFLAIEAMWHDALNIAGLHEEPNQPFSTHPGTRDRMDHLSRTIQEKSGEKTPGWYLHTFNAIRTTTELLPREILPGMIAEGGGAEALHRRVLPRVHASRGHSRSGTHEQWWKTIADMVTSSDKQNRTMGLWLLIQQAPHSMVGLYEALIGDDESFQKLAARALIAVEPMYEHYMPRLLERFRETQTEDALREYMLHISMMPVTKASMELGEDKIKNGPMWQDFFTEPTS